MTQENSYTAAFPQIFDVTSRPQDNLVLLYGTSTDDAITALPFRIERTLRRIERTTNGPTLAAGETLDFGYFGEGGHERDVAQPGEDVLEIETERDNTIVEFGVGFDTSDVYVGVESADGTPITGLREGADRARGFGPDDLPERGGVLSDYTITETPQAVPTTALSGTPEQGLMRIDSRQDGNNPLRFAFYNDSGGQVTLNMTAIGMAYEARPVYDRSEALSLVAGEGYKRRLVGYGGFGNTKPNLPREWQDATVQVEYGDVGPAFR